MANVSGSNLRGDHSDNIISMQRPDAVEIDLKTLPLDIQEKLKELEGQFNDDDITEKGFLKQRHMILASFVREYNLPKSGEELIEPDLKELPSAILNALDILKQEFDHEEITEKGYIKKRGKILLPYMLKEPTREGLPEYIQRQYAELEQELQDEELTEKGFVKRKMKLIQPYLIPINPSFYKLKSGKGKKSKPSQSNELLEAEKTKRLRKKVTSLQQFTEEGEKVFKCKICGEEFKLAQSFSGHCRLHRGERTKNYQCTLCTATYTTKSHLKFHMYKHTGDFPYNCAYCQKGFAGRSQLKYHELRHSGEAPYHCSRCQKKFWKKENLKRHQSHVNCIIGTTEITSSSSAFNADCIGDICDGNEDISHLNDEDEYDGLPSMTVSNTYDNNNNKNGTVPLPVPDSSCMLNSTVRISPCVVSIKKE